jgi:multidrug efflux pump subunit AcrB
MMFGFGPPALPGYGASSGFSMMIQARAGQPSDELADMTRQFIAEASQQPEIARISSTFSAGTPNYQLTIDRERAKQLGLALTDVYQSLQILLGGTQVNDFSLYGKNYKVMLQADADYREDIGALGLINVRSRTSGQMVPLSAVVTVEKGAAPRFTNRYNLYGSADISGAPAEGYSSGDAVAALERTAAKVLPAGYGYEWTGVTREEVETGNAALQSAFARPKADRTQILARNKTLYRLRAAYGAQQRVIGGIVTGPNGRLQQIENRNLNAAIGDHLITDWLMKNRQIIPCDAYFLV